MNDLVMFCGRCRAPIDGDTGFIGVRHSALARGHAAKRHAGLVPDPVIWEALHHSCDPDPSDDCYQIGADRIATYPALAWWTAHLMAKTWLPLTDWHQVLREAASEGSPSPRICARMESAA